MGPDLLAWSQQIIQLKHQHYATIAQDGATCDTVYLAQMRSEIFHHYVGFTSDLLNYQRHTLASSIDKQELGLLFERRRRQREIRREHTQWIMIVLDLHSWLSRHGYALKVIKASNRFYSYCRNSELLPTHTYHHSALNGQAGREGHRKCSALTWCGFYRQRSSKARDAIAHHIQTNAATAFLAQHLSSREAGAENEVDHITFTQMLIRTDQTMLNSGTAHTFWVNTHTIITHRNHNLVAF